MDQTRSARQFWDERYASKPAIWSGRPNPHLVAQVGGLARGSALDVGCGEGADAIWLAQQGWDVLGVDVSGVALERAAVAASAAGVRVTWERADLVSWSPDALSFDLVTSQFLHLPASELARVHATVRAAVRVGGTLLVVAHHPDDLLTSVRRPRNPDLFRTPAQLAEGLDEHWRIELADAPGRTVTDEHGAEVTVHDARLRAVRIA